MCEQAVDPSECYCQRRLLFYSVDRDRYEIMKAETETTCYTIKGHELVRADLFVRKYRCRIFPIRNANETIGTSGIGHRWL